MTVRSHFISRVLFVTVFFAFGIQCKMPELNNPGDPLSDEFAKQSVFAEFVRYFLIEKALPEALAVVLKKSTIPYEAGIRVYRVDSEIGVIDDYVSDVRASSSSAFPGCSPYRIGVPPRSRDIVTFTDYPSNRIVVHRYGTDRSISLLEDQPAIGTPRVMGFSSDGTTVYQINSASNPTSNSRWSRNPITGSLSTNNVGSYPYSVGCNPVAVRASDNDDLIFSLSTSVAPFGINVHKKSGPDSVTLVSGTPVTLPDNPAFYENLCIVESKRLLYGTSVNSTYPIYGYRYDNSGTLTLLPGSPFSPDSSFSAHIPNLNYSTSLAVDPTGNYAAFLYQTGATYNIRLLQIDPSSGNLIQTNQKFTAGNGPNALQWDKSGKFVYFTSDTGGTTNNYQIEYFKLSPDGTLSKGQNSPVIISPMANGYAPQDIKPIQRYYH
ncbi:hypothetical protein CH372_01455 [Leptospira meyeri]|uniref:hypothetical protein n=1 Tax=Leptospira meyeri TaxID=29508 RepID=UPI000C29992F|nr:hypothetical protein [Leptospira meyeri]PKA13993.1 hypothetical protein CH372_01455 [Leptospira meyeri]